ncbi:fatty acid--CoA ligase [Ramlibacter sp.]|uniref:fatty acid--CoA ligase n=1 Tax=Ramlibacter sp. TaxID=1917967 RepID=UPI0035B303F2
MTHAIPSIDPRFRTLGDLPRVHAARRPAHAAFIFEDRRTSWADFDRHCNRVAHALLALGLPPQSRIAWLGKNCDRFFEVFLGAAKARQVLVPVNWRLAPEEIAFILNDAEAQVLFVGADYLPLVDGLRAAVPGLRLVVAMDGPQAGCSEYVAWRDSGSDTDPRLAADTDETALQLYTSGTTGLPKGAELTHRNLLTQFSYAAAGHLGRWSEDDLCVVPLPLFHAGGVCYGMNAPYMGGTVVVLREAQPQLILQALAQHRVTKLGVVPAVMQFMLDHPDCAKADFSQLDAITYGGAPIPPALLRRAVEVMGPVFLQMFGMTESTTLGTALQPRDHNPALPERLKSCGQVLPGVELRIVTLEGKEALPGQSGEIWIRSAAIMKGYWKRPEATAEALRDGWYHTGDVGYLDIDGYLFILDRLKDMIISGGENIYPAEVERALGDHPAIAESAVIGVPDAKWGEAVKAMVVLRPGQQLTEAEVIAFTRSKIAAYKCPKTVEFIAALPRNPSGKILKRVLREPYWAGQARRVH